MIISASRRTDIPAFYSEWLMNRLKEGYLLVPHPRNPKYLSRIELPPTKVDCIVFWTKNPSPMLEALTSLTGMGYSYYMQFTLTPYDRTVETRLPRKVELLKTFREMSNKIGSNRSVWRYDPVIIDQRHSVSWHIECFGEMCKYLQGYTERCVISFVDSYQSLKKRYRELTSEEMIAIGTGFSNIASRYGITLYTCAEEIDLSSWGIQHGACIDGQLVEEIIGCPIIRRKDINQRTGCHCMESVDIGAYDTCSHGCTYCYATSDFKKSLDRMQRHDPYAPMISGYPKGDEIIKHHIGTSLKIDQLSLF